LTTSPTSGSCAAPDAKSPVLAKAIDATMLQSRAKLRAALDRITADESGAP
jgi:hypothetical protein